MSVKPICLLLVFLTGLAAQAQITPADIQFLALASRSRQMPYEESGGDMKTVGPLMAEASKIAATDRNKAYRAYTHALAIMNGASWTPDTELATALDFAINVKVVATGDSLQARATFLFDAPAATNAPYRMDLDILRSDGTIEASVAPGIMLGEVQSRRAGELIGLTFDPSRLVSPGLHTLRASLKNSAGTELYPYYRTFFVVKDLNKRMALLEKNLELLPRKENTAADTVRYLFEIIRQAASHYLARVYRVSGVERWAPRC